MIKMAGHLDLVIHHHLGLGDHLICNALVRYFARRDNAIGLFCNNRYTKSIQFMYRDVANLTIIPVTNDREAVAIASEMTGTKVLRVGFEHLDLKKFGESFYRQVGLEWRCRYSGFHVERNFAREEEYYHNIVGDYREYLFLHEDQSRGFCIDRARIGSKLRVIRPVPSENIFDYGLILERATEIHCIDSAFANLVESLPGIVARRLVLHGYARPTTSYEMFGRHPWTKLGLFSPGFPAPKDPMRALRRLRYYWSCWRCGWR